MALVFPDEPPEELENLKNEVFEGMSDDFAKWDQCFVGVRLSLYLQENTWFRHVDIVGYWMNSSYLDTFRGCLEHKKFHKYLKATAHRRFVRASKGYLALVPAETEMGDRIVLLAGGRVPVILRESGAEDHGTETWKLLGPAYVHGIMFGEGWKQADCQKFVIS